MVVITCPHCGIDVHLGDSGVRSGHSQSSGHGRRWQWEQDGEIVHTCTEPELADSALRAAEA
jgi:hypothetical protein